MSHTHTSTGSALREAGGDSFTDAVKEVSDKQSLSVTEGMYHVYCIITLTDCISV